MNAVKYSRYLVFITFLLVSQLTHAGIDFSSTENALPIDSLNRYAL